MEMYLMIRHFNLNIMEKDPYNYCPKGYKIILKPKIIENATKYRLNVLETEDNDELKN